MATTIHLVVGKVSADDAPPGTYATTATTTEETIRIGASSLHGKITAMQYHPPFTTQYYPYHVVKVLQQYPKATSTFEGDDENGSGDESNNEEMHQLRMASWYVDLGMAHRTVMEDYYIEHISDTDTNREMHSKMNEMDQPRSKNNHHNRNWIPMHKVYAVTAFQEAIHIYEALIRDYRQWFASYVEDKEDEYIHKETGAAATRNVLQQLIQEYEYFLANTMFALAETYTLVNNDDDMTVGFQYYHRAYRIYQQQRKVKNNSAEETEHNDDHPQRNNNDSNMEIHFAHCSIQLGLESVQYLHDLDENIVAEYEEGDPNHDRHRTGTSLSDVMEESILTFDHLFWTTFLMSFRRENEDVVDDKVSNKYTLGSVQEYLYNYHVEYFNGDNMRIEMYILQYILTEQAIRYFTDAIIVFRQDIQRQLQERTATTDYEMNTDDDQMAMKSISIIMQHQQTLVHTLQNLASCLYQYRPISTISTTNAIEYYEEAYDILSLQIIPTLLQQQRQLQNQKYNSDVLRSVHTMTDILFILSEMYFQLGDDDLSKERMQLCLQYHEEYQLDPPSNDPLLHGSATIADEMILVDDTERPISRKELLAQYEQLLEYYNAVVADISTQQHQATTQYAMNDDQLLIMDESSGYYYEKDDVYEADIHLSIGTLYLEEIDKGIRTSSITDAMTHFDQAVRLYEMSGDADNTTNMALAKYNLFLLHLRDGNYRFAARRYNEAIDWLRKVDAMATDFDLYDDDNSNIDPTLYVDTTNLSHQHKPRNHQPYRSSNQQQRKTLLKAETFTGSSKTGTKMDRATNEENNEDSASSATVAIDKPSIHVDLQHFLSQNQSVLVKEEL